MHARGLRSEVLYGVSTWFGRICCRDVGFAAVENE